MADTALRSLAKAYAKKNLEHAAYREARAKFIRGVLSGEAELTVNVYPPLIRPRLDEASESTVRRSDKKKTPLTETAGEHSPLPATGLNKTLLAGAVVAIVIIVAVIIFAVTGTSTQTAGNAPPTRASTATTKQPNAAQLLVKDLLSQDNWDSNASLDAFLQTWQTLPADVRSNAIGTLELNQLTTAIYRQLLKERALAGIGNGNTALQKQQRLVDFAHTIGIRDPKIAMPQ